MCLEKALDCLAKSALAANFKPTHNKINLQAFALVKSGRIKDAMAVMSNAIKYNLKYSKFCAEVMNELSEAVKQNQDEELQSNLTQLCSDIGTHRYNIVETTLEELVFTPIESIRTRSLRLQ